MAVRAIHGIAKHFNDDRKKISGKLRRIFPELPATNEI